jgi:hypothetical protein
MVVPPGLGQRVEDGAPPLPPPASGVILSSFFCKKDKALWDDKFSLLHHLIEDVNFRLGRLCEL